MMYEAPGTRSTRSEPFSTKSSRSICAKYFSRKRRQRPDGDALAYGYIHPEHLANNKYKRTLSPPPPYTMYGQQPYDQPPPARFYQQGFASQQDVSSLPPRNRPYRRPQVWNSSSTLNLRPQHIERVDEVWHRTSDQETPPPKPPRPDQKHVHFGRRPEARDKTSQPAPAVHPASTGGSFGSNLDPRETRQRIINEDLWLEALDRELTSVEQDQQTEHPESERSVRRDNPQGNKSKTGLINYGKTWMFANSRLPPHQPPFKAFFETWRLICRAARSSAQVYQRPKGDQREHFIAADRRHRTKAMVLKSTPLDDQNLIIFSIRGSQINYTDWDINLHPAPAAPEGFLDDGTNACHSGFLKVAKAMVAPVAARLRQLLEQDPSRCASSLLITGHSAGGAVASLLYMHMLATTVESELNVLTGCFKRVHCVTFGVPPVSFLPLEKPSHMRANKSLFLSFANEGDLVVRADKAYLLSLARILAGSKGNTGEPGPSLAKKASHAVLRPGKAEKETNRAPYWPVPEAPLSNAGRIVLLREKPGPQKSTSIEAVTTSDERLRDVVFGDPAMHSMLLYQQRVEALAFAAMLGDDGS